MTRDPVFLNWTVHSSILSRIWLRWGSLTPLGRVNNPRFLTSWLNFNLLNSRTQVQLSWPGCCGAQVVVVLPDGWYYAHWIVSSATLTNYPTRRCRRRGWSACCVPFVNQNCGRLQHSCSLIVWLNQSIYCCMTALLHELTQIKRPWQQISSCVFFGVCKFHRWGHTKFEWSRLRHLLATEVCTKKRAARARVFLQTNNGDNPLSPQNKHQQWCNCHELVDNDRVTID